MLKQDMETELWISVFLHWWSKNSRDETWPRSFTIQSSDSTSLKSPVSQCVSAAASNKNESTVCFLRKFHYQYIHKNLLDESTAVCWALRIPNYLRGGSVAEWLACWTQAQKGRVQIAVAMLSGNILGQTAHTHCASVPPGLWLRHLQADCQELGSAPEPYAR